MALGCRMLRINRRTLSDGQPTSSGQADHDFAMSSAF